MNLIRVFYFLVVVYFSISLTAKEVWVSTEGGTQEFNDKKYATVPLKEALQNLNPDTTIYLLPGIYSEHLHLNYSSKPDHPLRIVGLNDKVVWDGQTKPGAIGAPAIRMKNCAWIEIEGIHFQNFWPYTFRVEDCEYISVRNCRFEGAKRVVFAYGKKTHHLLVEHNHWVQDSSGAMWRSIPWAESHHGEYAHYNGALLASKRILGSVVFRYNTVRYAYNGIRLVGNDEDIETDNFNVEVYHNRFDYIRDNPIEPERSANNWWMHHNEFYNCYAPFSFTGVAGGEWYIFRNFGWFDEGPGSKGGHDRGKIYKFSKEGPFPSKNIYAYHNSWYSRNPLITGGKSRNFYHKNNAIFYAKDVAPVEIGILKSRKGFHPSYRFDYNLANQAYPEDFTAAKQEKNSLVKNFDFQNPTMGNLKLPKDSPAVDKGTIWRVGNWESKYSGEGPDLGAFEGEEWLPGPPFQFDDTHYQERPRIVQSLADDKKITLFFSVPLRTGTTTVEVVEEKKESIEVSLGGYKVVIPSHSPNAKIIFQEPPMGENGLPATLWSSVSTQVHWNSDS